MIDISNWFDHSTHSFHRQIAQILQPHFEIYRTQNEM